MSIEEEPKKVVGIEIGQQAAEEILISLAHRTRDRGMPKGQQSDIIELGKRLSQVFEKEFAADPKWFDRILENAQKITVRITCQR
jgi:hypothetical protein